MTTLDPTHPRLCFDSTTWSRLLWEIRRDRAAALKPAMAATRLAVSDAHAEMATGPDGRDGLDAFAETMADALGGEVFSRLYGDPDRLDRPRAPRWAPAVWEMIEDLPEWSSLRASTASDPDLSAIATARLLGVVAERLPKLADEFGTDEDGEWPEPSAPSAGGLPTDSERFAAAMSLACEQAEQEVHETKSGLAGLSPGLEVAPPRDRQEDPARLELAERLRSDDRLRSVVERAGRIRRISKVTERTRTDRARSQVVSIERGGDVSRILPSQLVGLRHPQRRLLVMRGIVERSLMQYQLGGTEPLGRGPMTVVVDRSGSMRNQDRNGWASAIALACLSVAAKERRACTVVDFNGGITRVLRLSAKGEGERILVNAYTGDIQGIKRIGGVADVALRIATAGCGGGTDFTPPLTFATSTGSGCIDDRADIVFVTDGLATADDELVARLAAAKERGVRIYGLTVGGGQVSPAIRAVCDEVTDLFEKVDPARSGAAVVPQ